MKPATIPRSPALSLTELMHSKVAQSPLTHGILLVNVLVFLVMLSQGAGLWHTSNGVQLAWGANFGPATQDGQWWRLLTAAFIHFGVIHLSMNMFALRDVGRLVERVYGPWKFGLIYGGAGLLGNLLSLVVQGNQAISGGASGAIFGLYGALLVFLLHERRQVDASEFRWLFAASSFFTLLMLGLGWVIPGIDNAAHGGGLLGGALLARLLIKPWTAQSPLKDRKKWLALALLISCSGWLMMHIPAPKYLLHEEIKAREAIQHFRQADQHITQQWEAILNNAAVERLSFDQVAWRLDATVTAGYQNSFNQLLAATPQSQAPSALELNHMQTYAQERAQTSLALADGLRTRNPDKIRSALRRAKTGPDPASKALPASPPTSTNAS
jgi:rhomboid protease GluP